MMHNWFECKVSYEKIMEDGKQKKVTEPYLVDALSFTEAEARIIEELTPFISGEFVIKDIKRAKLSEIFFNENGDRFYKIKVYFITIDEKSGAEKKTATQMLIQASNLKEAIEVLEKGRVLWPITKSLLSPKPHSWIYSRMMPKMTKIRIKQPTPTIHPSANSSSPYLKDVRRKSPYRERRSS